MSSHRQPLPLRFARRLIDLAARRAPAGDRDRFLREWHGEIDFEARGSGGWSAPRTALGAFADARALRRIARFSRGGFTMRNGLGGWIRDLGAVVRGIRHSPGFAMAAILTLGLGIGSAAAMFTVIKRVVIDPLPYPEPARLVRLQNRVPGVAPDAVWHLSTAQFVYFTDHARTLEAVALYRPTGGNVMTPSGPRRARAVSVTASLLPLLGARVALGRSIAPADDVPSAAPVALVSSAFWRDVLGGNPAAVGSSLSYDGAPVEVIGVLDAHVELPGWSNGFLPGWSAGAQPDLWLPMRINRGGPFHNNHVFPAIGRLAPGQTPATVETELAGLTRRFPEAFPDVYSQSFFDRYGFRTEALPLKDDLLGDLTRNLWILFAGVAFVLVIACANVANLFVVRMDARRREMGIRAALGASRWTLARHVLAESVTLAVIGAVVALLVCFWALPALIAVAPADLPRLDTVRMDGYTVAFTFALALAVGLALAAYPAFVSSRRGSAAALADSGRSVSAGRERQRLRGTLIVLQVAFALTLTVGAGLLVTTLVKLHAMPLGFEPAGVVSADLYLSQDRYQDDAAIWRLDRDLLARIRALPGVQGAGMSEELPIAGGFGCTVQGFEDKAVFDRIKQAGLTTCAGQEATSPGYFEALGIPVLEGRTLADADNDDPARAAVVVSTAFADRFWPGEDPIGKAVAPSGVSNGTFHHVVGVVGDVPKRTEAGGVPLSQPAMAIYYPMRHDPANPWNRGWWPGYMSLVVKTSGADPRSIVPSLRRVVSEADPEIPMANVTTMEAVAAGATSQLAFVSTLLALAAAAALLLAAVGLYGTILYVVSRRTREIGMRLAIGAQPGRVQRAVVGRSLALAGLGMVAGVGLALVTTRAMRSLLVGVEPSDPLIYAAAAALLVAVALLASWMPARRAARIDPVIALRME